VPPVVSRYPPNTPASQLKYHLTSSTGLSMVSYFMKIHLPYINKLIDRSKEMGYPESRVLFICYATKASEGDTWADFVTMDAKLHIIPQPTGVLNPFQLRKELDKLYFNQPDGTNYPITPPAPPTTPSPIGGQLGDIFILQRDTCDGVADSKFKLPTGPSSRVILEEGGVAGVKAIAGGMLNELELNWNYRICYATAESGGDVQSDFIDLAKYLMIRLDERAPTIELDTTVAMGEDIVVRWHANHGLEAREAHALDWIGLYKAGDCTEEDPFREYGEFEAPAIVKTKHNSVHECYLASATIEDNVQSGIVRFPISEYKGGGQFDVRYFLGDSRHGQGYVCRGLRNRSEGDYVHCVLEARFTSDVVTVVAPTAVSMSNEASDIGKVPGLESYCDGPLCSYD